MSEVRSKLVDLEDILDFYENDLMNQQDEESTVYEETSIEPEDVQRLKTLMLEQQERVSNDNKEKNFDRLSEQLAAKRLFVEKRKKNCPNFFLFLKRTRRSEIGAQPLTRNGREHRARTTDCEENDKTKRTEQRRKKTVTFVQHFIAENRNFYRRSNGGATSRNRTFTRISATFTYNQRSNRFFTSNDGDTNHTEKRFVDRMNKSFFSDRTKNFHGDRLCSIVNLAGRT